MKPTVILTNFILSIVALSAGLIALPWFFIACAILIRADKLGKMDSLKNKLGFNDL